MTAHRYVLLDGFRGIAAIAVVIGHFTQHTGHRNIFPSAGLAVDLFFCLSGFVIAYSYYDRIISGMSFGDFARRRLIRLYPIYIIGLALGTLALSAKKICDLTDYTWLSIVKATALNLFYFPYFNNNYIGIFKDQVHGAIFPANHPFWSLFFELLANLAFFVAATKSRRVPLILTTLAGFGLLIATVVYGEEPGWGADNFIGGIPRVLFSFFAGVVIFQYRDKLGVIPRMKPAFLMIGLSALFLVPAFHGHSWYWLSLALLGVPLVVAAGSLCVLDKDQLLGKSSVYFGRLSYPIYCVHFPLLLIVSSFFDASTPYPLPHNALIMTGSLVATFVLTHMLMQYVDEPIRGWLSRRFLSSRALPQRDPRSATSTP